MLKEQFTTNRKTWLSSLPFLSVGRSKVKLLAAVYSQQVQTAGIEKAQSPVCFQLI